MRRDSDTGKFVSSSKTGRVVKASPAMSRLGKERIKTAVKSVVYREMPGPESFPTKDGDG